jgi:protein-disulfide isomerase
MKLPLKFLTGLFVLLYFASLAFAADGSSLKPPPGARVAVVMFEDLECPTCARTFPVVWDAANSRKVPVVLHDFPLPLHRWSFDAAVYARYFDTHSQKLGDDFRGYIYKNQINVNLQNLRQFVQKFADDNKVPLPFVVDPEGKLKSLVKADANLGQQLGINQTPTIFVIGTGGTATPFVEVETTQLTQLSQIIEDMQKKSGAAAPAKPATAARAKSHKKK